MRIKAKRRGRKLYHAVVHDYREPVTGRRCQLAILPLGKHATVAAALKETDERIGWLKIFEAKKVWPSLPAIARGCGSAGRRG
jgi:hypothetical protein